MLKIKSVGATLPAQDVARARKFYEQKLGFKPTGEAPDGGTRYQVGNSEFGVFKSLGKASGDHTQLALEVDDVDNAVGELKKAGVKIEEYDVPGFKTEMGIITMPDGSKGAWFKDTEGNLITLIQAAPVAASSGSQGSTTASR